MLYELTLNYENGITKKETADLPTLMHCLSYYMEEEPWHTIDIMNCQTGEIIAMWEHNEDYGVTTR